MIIGVTAQKNNLTFGKLNIEVFTQAVQLTTVRLTF